MPGTGGSLWSALGAITWLAIAATCARCRGWGHRVNFPVPGFLLYKVERCCGAFFSIGMTVEGSLGAKVNRMALVITGPLTVSASP